MKLMLENLSVLWEVFLFYYEKRINTIPRYSNRHNNDKIGLSIHRKNAVLR
jgi:hypothetical protein